MAQVDVCAVERTFTIQAGNAFDFNGATQRVGVHVRSQGLLDNQCVHQAGGDHIQCNRTRTSFWSGDFSTVNRYGIEVCAQTTNTNETAFTLIALDRQTRDTLKCLGGVRVWQLTDGVGVNRADDAVGVALTIQSTLQLGGLTDNQHFFHFLFTFVEQDIGSENLLISNQYCATFNFTTTDGYGHGVLTRSDLRHAETTCVAGQYFAIRFFKADNRVAVNGVAGSVDDAAFNSAVGLCQ